MTPENPSLNELYINGIMLTEYLIWEKTLQEIRQTCFLSSRRLLPRMGWNVRKQNTTFRRKWWYIRPKGNSTHVIMEDRGQLPTWGHLELSHEVCGVSRSSAGGGSGYQPRWRMACVWESPGRHVKGKVDRDWRVHHIIYSSTNSLSGEIMWDKTGKVELCLYFEGS